MDKSVTVSVRGLIVVGFVLLALTVAYLLGNARGNPAAAADSDDDGERPTPRTLTMRGLGEATAVPDQLAFTLYVAMVRPDLDSALADSSEAMRQVIAALKEEGVDEQDMQTAGLSMTPVYDRPRRQAPVLRGYRVSQQASVRVDELDAGGKVVSAAVAAGGNAVRVNDLRLQVAEPESVLAEARSDAVEQATAKAAEYAEATGQ